MSFKNKAELRSYYGEPTERVRKKQLSRLDVHCRNFIALSPFLVMSTAAADGSTDASPKGDVPGFVVVQDDHTLLIPDRPGNNRVDSFQNLLENPHVGLLFFVPGMNETLRVNGRARLTIESEALAPMSVNGKTPRAALVVQVEEAYLHCAKALIRSRLWGPETQIDRKSFPTMGQMMADQIGGLDPVEVQKSYEERNRNRLY